MTATSATTRLLVLVAALALPLAACGGGTETAEEAGTPTAVEQTAASPADQTTASPADETADGAAAASTVEVASSDLGDILVDGEGMTLYVFMPDEGGEPTCTAGCAETWPPLEGPAGAGEGAEAGMLGTVEHPGAGTQVTYNDWPLYHFANDQAAGDTNGQGVGGNWYVIGPDGEPIRNAAAQGSGARSGDSAY